MELSRLFKGSIVYITESVKSYIRQRLIQKQIQFIVPGNQLFLPEFGYDLREYYRSKNKSTQTLTPAALSIVLLFLNTGDDCTVYTYSDLISLLNYSPMTISRSAAELEVNGLVKIGKKGREKTLSFIFDKHDLWEKKINLFRSPVIKRIWILNSNHYNIKSGLLALSFQTELDRPDYDIIAVHVKNWKKSEQKARSLEVDSYVENATQVELWSYNPELFAKNGIVDNYSLYLSLMNEVNDERIQIALDRLIGDHQ